MKAKPLIRLYAFHDTILSKPFVALLQRLCSQKQKIMILGETQEYMSELDHYLWSYSDISFLPHSMEKNEHAPDQPIWLSCDSYNMNNAENIVLVEGAGVKNIDAFDSVFEVFSTKEKSHMEKAQERYKKYLNLSYKTQYYSQSETGEWSSQ
jgi:DNA polymerase III subunit chi